MFGAIAHQLFRRRVGSDIYASLTMVLRDMVVEYLYNNSGNEDFVSLILLRVNDEFPHLRGVTSAIAISNFLNALKVYGVVWGASESILELASIFECEVVVFRERGFQTLVTNESVVSRGIIHVVYRGDVNAWNHYDSFLNFVDDDGMCIAEIGDDKLPPSGNETWWCVVRHVGGSCIALKTEAGGNCLSSALSHQLFGLDIQSAEHSMKTTSLSEQIVDHIRLNLRSPRYGQLLDDRISSDYPQLTIHDEIDIIELI